MLVDPAVRDPVLVGMRGQFPLAGSPNIRSSVPAVITTYPDIAGARRDHPRLNYGMWRRHANHNLFAERAEGQTTCENNSDQSLLEHQKSPFLVILATQSCKPTAELRVPQA